MTDWNQSECERKVITMMTSREFRRLVVAVSNGYAAADKRVDAANREEFLRHVLTNPRFLYSALSGFDTEKIFPRYRPQY